MSLCSRAAVLRNPKSNLLRLLPRSTPCSPGSRLFTQSRIAPQHKLLADLRRQHRCFSTTRFLREQSTIEPLANYLPVCCPGCGAFSQTVEANEPGYYGTSRKSIRKLLAVKREAVETQNEAANRASSEIDGILAEQNDTRGEAAPPRPIEGGTHTSSLERAIC
jgi:hypothetical protein